jgi:hypothetical protein
MGRSPRVRGSHALANAQRAKLGSIPACAGEPLPSKGLIFQPFQSALLKLHVSTVAPQRPAHKQDAFVQADVAGGFYQRAKAKAAILIPVR